MENGKDPDSCASSTDPFPEDEAPEILDGDFVADVRTRREEGQRRAEEMAGRVRALREKNRALALLIRLAQGDAPPKGRPVSQWVTDRVDCAVAIMKRGEGAFGVTELHHHLMHELGPGRAGGYQQVTDMLRRYPDVFENVGHGLWTLRGGDRRTSTWPAEVREHVVDELSTVRPTATQPED